MANLNDSKFLNLKTFRCYLLFNSLYVYHMYSKRSYFYTCSYYKKYGILRCSKIDEVHVAVLNILLTTNVQH